MPGVKKLPRLKVYHLPHPEQTLKISGAISLLPLYSFTAWTGKILALPFTSWVLIFSVRNHQQSRVESNQTLKSGATHTDRVEYNRVRENPIGFQSSLNSAQANKSTAMENFNLSLLQTIRWGRSASEETKNVGASNKHDQTGIRNI
jgi:hypothetical protein